MPKGYTNSALLLLLIIFLSSCTQGESDADSSNVVDAAYWYRKAFDFYEEPDDIKLHTFIYDYAELTEQLKQYLEKQRPVTELMIKATKIYECEWDNKRYSNIWMPIDNLNAKTIRGSFSLLLADIRCAEEKASPMEILDHCQSLCQFSKHLDLVNSSGVDYLIRLNIKLDTFKYIHSYLKRHPQMAPEELMAFYKFVEKQDILSIDDVLNTHLEFAKTALSEHANKNLDNMVAKILDVEKSKDRRDFFEGNLSVYKDYIADLHTIAKKSLEIMLPEMIARHEILHDELESIYSKFTDYSDNFEPSLEDYEFLIKHGKSFFSAVHMIPVYQIRHNKAIVKTQRNALLTGILILIEYNKTGIFPEEVLPNSPHDGFGDRPFDMIKNNNNFILKSRSIDSQKKEYHEFSFSLL